jgi:hypothetical protein
MEAYHSEDARYMKESIRGGTFGFNITLDNYKWANNKSVVSREPLTNIPYLQIEEYQPDYAYNYGDVVEVAVDAIFATISSGAKALTSGPLGLATKVSSGTNIFGAVIGGGVSSVGKGIESLASNATTIIGAGFRLNSAGTTISKLTENGSLLEGRRDTAKLYRDLLPGDVIGRYQIPYIGDTFLETTHTGWSQSGSAEVFGEKASKWMEANTNYTAIGVPQWTLKQGGTEFPMVEVKLNLYNDHITNLSNNYQLIHSLMSGASWLQSGSQKKSPNLFHVTCPGRFTMPLSSMSVSVKYGGMVRHLHENSYDHISAKVKGMNPFDKGVNTGFPDVYHVTLQFKCMLPNNFNTFLLYTHGDNENYAGIQPAIRKSELERAKSSVDPILKGVIKPIQEKAAGIAKAVGDKIAQTGKAVVDGAGEVLQAGLDGKSFYGDNN